jgi:peptidoglycan/xylan/chitin deacetylase (PgdA/CDA1 family)
MNKRIIRTFIILECIISFVIVLTDVQANLHKQQNREGVVYWHGDSTQHKIALTFDDGPQDVYTPQILDILKKYHVKATFFLIGKNVEAFPEVAKRIAQEGHCIGNHTYSHPDLILKNKEQIRLELQKTEEAIYNATGVRPYLFRPPYGADNHWVSLEVENLGYVIIQWSVSGLNGRKDSRFDKLAQKVITNTKNGSIILLHDGNRLSNKIDRSQIIKALPIIIETLQRQGYQFVTIPELLNLS